MPGAGAAGPDANYWGWAQCKRSKHATVWYRVFTVDAPAGKEPNDDTNGWVVEAAHQRAGAWRIAWVDFKTTLRQLPDGARDRDGKLWSDWVESPTNSSGKPNQDAAKGGEERAAQSQGGAATKKRKADEDDDSERNAEPKRAPAGKQPNEADEDDDSDSSVFDGEMQRGSKKKGKKGKNNSDMPKKKGKKGKNNSDIGSARSEANSGRDTTVIQRDHDPVALLKRVDECTATVQQLLADLQRDIAELETREASHTASTTDQENLAALRLALTGARPPA
jgi:hypothetical protein